MRSELPPDALANEYRYIARLYMGSWCSVYICFCLNNIRGSAYRVSIYRRSILRKSIILANRSSFRSFFFSSNTKSSEVPDVYNCFSISYNIRAVWRAVFTLCNATSVT